jgi:hypothetical protein
MASTSKISIIPNNSMEKIGTLSWFFCIEHYITKYQIIPSSNSNILK